MNYRREIDGLRAVAVVPVIFFHAGFEFFQGGFIGVDIFFVISGYLITSIILSDMVKGEFSLTNFYERRIRRIFPVLFFIILCCIPFAWLWFLPVHLKEFSESILAASTFSSNIYFWREIDYFSTSTELKPLVHTWSLAVEEQYYILFPIFLMVLWKLPKQWMFLSVLIITLLSLILAQWGSHHHPKAAFFLLPTRIWELSIGGLIAFYFIFRHDQSEIITSYRITSEFLGLFGLSLIFYSIFVFDKTLPFPSFYTLIPTIGAALIILFSSSNTLAGRLLSSKYFVGIGLISYSAYLWHQPLFAFARYRMIEEPSNALLLLLSFVCLLLAYVSWFYIEKPFRNVKFISRKNVFKAAIFISLIMGIFGFASSRYIESPMDDFTHGHCNTNTGDCYSLVVNDFTVALWGDSYADSFAMKLGESLNSNNISLDLYTKNSCPSIWPSIRNGDPQLGKDFSMNCYKHNNHSFNEIMEKKPKYVLLANAYDWYMSGHNIDGKYLLTGDGNDKLLPSDYIPTNLKDLLTSFNSVGITPILLTPHPRVHPFFEYYKKFKYGLSLYIPADYIRAENARDTLLSKLLGLDFKYHEINGLKLFCHGKNDKCSIIGKHNNLVLFDGSHFSATIANQVASKVLHIVVVD